MMHKHAFVSPSPVCSKHNYNGPGRTLSEPRILPTPTPSIQSRRCDLRMELPIGKPSLYTGVAILTAVLVNRLVLTPLDSLAMTQSRSDILGVIAGATLVLYGVGKAEIVDGKKAVEMEGEDICQGFEGEPSALEQEVQWAADAVFKGVPNVKSFAFIDGGLGRFFVGKFREKQVELRIVEGGTIYNAMNSGRRAYLADMKVVPVKETEFGFLPQNCQAVIVQPISQNAALVLGADKPRPLTGSDFGWLQAVANRLADVLA